MRNGHMEYTTLGRSGLKVSVVGLGGGGPSKLGQAARKSEKESIQLVRQALDMGLNVLDTAEVYGTESIVGKAIMEIPRDTVVISTKKHPPSSSSTDPAGELRKGLEQSLKKLRTDYVDIYHLHGVTPEQYSYSSNVLAPVLMKMREEGKIRSLGITENFVPDTRHEMLRRALKDGCWDVVMVGFNILNQSARNWIFRETLERDVGVLVMFALRRSLSRSDRLKQVIAELKQKGLVAPGSCDPENPLAFLTRDGKASSIPDAAYRYCRHEPGVHVVLTGTGEPDHLRANVESLLKPPLPEEDLLRLKEMFAKVDCVSGN
jgi:aryl-alcohol dehydrogenase-like predicted oxidoreductase